MKKLLALAIAAGCYHYAAPGSGRFVEALVLPGVGLVARVYLLELPTSLFVAGVALLWPPIDLYGEFLLPSLILPLLLVLWLLLYLYWAWKAGYLRGGRADGGGGYDSGDGGDCGGDGGGDCDGGGDRGPASAG